MKRKNKLWWIPVSLLAICFAVFVLYNIRHNEEFWSASAVNIITILIAVVISYFLVQRKSDRRKQKEILLDLINKLRLLIDSEETYDFTGQSREEIMMRNRDISNKVQILTNLQTVFGIEEDMKFIQEKTEEYLSLVGDHSMDLDYLIKSKKELQRPLMLISTKLVSMSIDLFQ